MTSRRVSVTVDADLSPYNRGLVSGIDNTRNWIRELESADSRMAAIVQTSLALVPALVPIGAAAVPAIAGLVTQLGFAAVAGGTTMLAFQGVGDALGALNDYQLDPTSEKLAKLTEKLNALGPAGEIFVRQLQDMRSEFQVLQDVAQEELFPGAVEGLDSLMTQMPRFERVIASVAGALGDLTDDAGADLASPEWSEFFEYLDREAGPILESTGQSIGNLVEGITNLVMAGDPLSDDWLAGLLESSQDFVEWSDNLDSSQGFQNFVRYVQESGPQAMDTLGAIANMLVEFVEAAAPVGVVVLPILETLADVLAAIADSPAGPVIVGAAAAIGTLGRSLALLSAVGLRGGGDSLFGKIFATDKIKAGVSAMQLGQQSLYNITTASERAEMSATQLAASRDRQTVAEQKRTAAMKAGAAQMGKNAAALGGLALMTTGVADGMGLSNTMSMALMGTLAGPWGVAIGGGIGLLTDFAKAGNLAEDMQTQLAASIRSAGLDFEAQNAAVQAGADRLADYWDQQSFLGQSFEGWDYVLTGESAFHAIAEAQAEAEAQALDTQQAFTQIALAFDEDFGKDGLGRSIVPDLEDLTRVAERAQPAMQALGITAEDLADMDHTELSEAAGAIAEWTTNADSAEGRTRAVADAFRALDDDLIDTSYSADMVKTSLDALLDPGMSLSAANDAWTASLRELKDELSENSSTLRGNSNAALENRAAVRDRVSAIKDVLNAEANAGASAKELSARLRNQREALLDAGDAAGLSRKQMENYLTTLGLTPDLVKTLIKAETTEAMANINGFKFQWDRIKDKTVYLRTVELRSGPGGQGNGYDPSARGNIFPSVKSFAWGDFANAHQPELAGPGPTRIWREPETMGEAYIPLANDSRRPRARSILEDTASHLGGSVQWFANGGSTRRATGGIDDASQEARERRREERERRAAERRELREAAAEAEVARAARHAEREQRLLELVAKAQLDAAEAQLDAAEKTFDAATESLRATEQQRDALKESVASQFRGSLTGGGLAGLAQTLDRDINAGSAMDETLRALVEMGLDTTGASAGLFQELSASEDIRTATELLAAGPEYIAMLEQQFAEREAINTSRGDFVGDASYGALIAQQAAAVTLAQAQLDQATAATREMQARLDTLTGQAAEQIAVTQALAGEFALAMNSLVQGGYV